MERSGANPGRAAAARALIAVDHGDHVEDVLAGLLEHATADDRGLAWFLALGALRHRSHVDAALRPWLTRPLGSLDPDVRAVLRVSTFEKLYARTAPHAVVHQAVEVAAAIGAGRAKGMVNAILRRVTTPTELTRAEEVDHPAWLVDRWVRRYGEAAALAWCRANNEPPPLFVVSADPTYGDALKAAGLEGEPASLGGVAVDRCWRVEGLHGGVPTLPGFAEGRFWVQDAASVAVADLVPAGPVLDACAAPGGKTFRLRSRGLEVLAVDHSAERLALLSANAKRLGLDVPTRVHDWTKGPLEGVSYPAVLVDAPCSALGTVRRHPEVRWRRQPEELVGLAERQQRILANASLAVAAGGALIYAVCSPEPEEGPKGIEAFVAAHPEFSVVETRSTAPPEHGEDAFFGARLQRG